MPDVSEFERLKEMVAKLRAKDRATSDPRTLDGSDAAGRLAALLAEINETILPRRLIFRSDESTAIQLAVSNRRLQGVLSRSSGPLEALAGKPLSDPEDQLAGDLKDALLTALEQNGPFKIRSVHLGEDDLGSDAGLAAEVLVRHWGIESVAPEGAVAEDALSAFLSALEGSTTAWLSVEGEDVKDRNGSEADVARLGERAAYLLDAYLNGKDSLYGAEKGPTSYGVASASEGVFFADTGEHSVFVLTTPKDLVKVAGAWRASFG